VKEFTVTNTRTRNRIVRIAGLASCAACALVAVLGAQTAPATPRIPPIPESQRTAEQKRLADQYAPLGMANFTATYLNYPDLAKLVPHMVYYLGDQSTLPPRHRALLALRTAWLTRSEYLWAHRIQPSRDSGLTADEMTRVARGPDAAGWDPFEAAVLRAADELHVDSIISDTTWATLSARYSIPQLIDTIDTVGDLTMHAGIVNSIGIPIEAGVSERMPSVPFVVAAKRTNMRLEGRAPRIPPQDAAAGRAGAGGNVFRTFNRNPPADRVRGTMNTHVNNGNALPPKYRETLLMRIGILCRSEYEYAAHHRVGRQAGLTDADVARILAGPGSGTGTPFENALLKAADELFEKDVVSNDTWSTLAKDLDTKQLFDVLITVGGYRSNSMLINSAGVQLDANMTDYRFPASLR
jgi:alkylhydroperoxidase family enzyme